MILFLIMLNSFILNFKALPFIITKTKNLYNQIPSLKHLRKTNRFRKQIWFSHKDKMKMSYQIYNKIKYRRINQQ